MAKKIWFGNVSFAQWVPAPATGMAKSVEGYSEEIEFDNGGLWLERSNAGHTIYEINIPPQDSSAVDGIEAYQRFAEGDYGSDYIRFIDPMRSDENLLTPSWAAPGLAAEGHKAIYDTIPTFSATGANSYGKPSQKPTYGVTGASAAVPVGQNSVFTLLIPPTHTLHFGASGTATGTAVLRVQPINVNGTLATPVDITMTADSAAPAFSNTFSGATYKAVRIYITRTSSATSTITPTAMWARVVLTGTTPTISRHIPGKGHSGLKFRGSARVEVYTMVYGKKVGTSLELAEVEPWQ